MSSRVKVLRYLLVNLILLVKSATALQGNCSLDAAVSYTYNNRLYLFKGEKYARWNDVYDRIEAIEYIKDGWDLPNDLDAAVTWNGLNYFFKGCIAYEYNSSFSRGRISRKRNLSDWNIPCNIDAATVWSDYVYFFKGENVWTWHYNKEELIEGPASIDTWNVESNIDAAVQWFFNKRVYIFKRFTYWRINTHKQIEGTSSVPTGWVGLLDSTLFPDCACDCMDGPNRVSWRFEKVNFEVEFGHTKDLQELEVTKHVIDLRKGNPEVQKEFMASKNIVETESFNHSTGIALVSRFKTTTPHSKNGKIDLIAGGISEFILGSQKETSTEKSKVFTCPSFANMKVTCIVTLQMQELILPYTMTLRHIDENCTCISRGSYNKISFSHMHLSVKQGNKD